MGMAASGATSHTLLITCIAGLISGASSMAAGEYISVKSQSDIEEADLKHEARELDKNPHLELKELTQIYIQRGLEPELAHEVAVQLSAHDALSAHARDEIGIHENTSAKPLEAGGFFCPRLFTRCSVSYAGHSIKPSRLSDSVSCTHRGTIVVRFRGFIELLFWDFYVDRCISCDAMGDFCDAVCQLDWLPI